MKTFYTYIWFDPKDQTPRYVGKGAGKRVWDHIQDKSSTYFSRLIKKRHAAGFMCIPKLVWFDSEDEAYEFEKLLIAEIGRQDLGLGPLLNTTDGGRGAVGLSPWSARKMSESVSRSMKGKKHTAEHQAAINATHAINAAKFHGVTVKYWTSLTKYQRSCYSRGYPERARKQARANVAPESRPPSAQL